MSTYWYRLSSTYCTHVQLAVASGQRREAVTLRERLPRADTAAAARRAIACLTTPLQISAPLLSACICQQVDILAAAAGSARLSSLRRCACTHVRRVMNGRRSLSSLYTLSQTRYAAYFYVFKHASFRLSSSYDKHTF